MKLSRPLIPTLIPTLAAALLFGLVPAAFAQDKSDDAGLRNRLSRIEKQLGEVRSIVLQARATGHPVEVKDAGPDPQVADLQAKFDDLTQSLRGLTGQIEAMSHDMEQARKDAAQAQAQATALAERLDRLEKQAAALAPPPAPPAPPPPSAGGPTDGGAAAQDAPAAYAHARKMLLDGDYPGASAAFQDYIDRFGDDPGAAAARYWLGETKYIQSDYAGAAAAFIAAVHGWPKTTWAPDAVIKLSLSLIQLNKTDDACRTLAEISRHYPRLSAAARARAEAARAKASCAG